MTNTSSLRTNTQSPFTLHYAIWPFIGLISLIVTVWLVVYISASVARRHSLKNDQRNLTSLYVTQNSVTVGGSEASAIMSPTSV